MKKLNLIIILAICSTIILMVTGCGLTKETSNSTIFMTTPTTLLSTMDTKLDPTTTLTPTPAVDPTITKTILPVSTLSELERESYVRESLSSSSNCKLPCWFGITPGQTTWKDAEQHLNYLGVKIVDVPEENPDAIWHLTVGFDFEKEPVFIPNRFDFQEADKTVNVILVTSEGYNSFEEFQTLWENYSPQKLVITYGIPDRVLLDVVGAYGSNSAGYFLWLFYDKTGVSIRYDGWMLEKPIYHICPKIGSEGDIGRIEMVLQNPDNPLPLDRFDAILQDKNPSTVNQRIIKTIKDATGMNEKEFFRIFNQSEPVCFDTPQEIWVVK